MVENLKKIAYIEIDTHAEIAQNFLELMLDSEKFAVDYYFSEKIKKQIQTGKENVFLSDSSMIIEQLKVKKYDLIIVGTVHRYFNTFQAIAEKYNTAFIVHNINFTTLSKLSLFRNIFKEDLIYRLKLWWKEGLFNASEAYKKAKILLVLDEAFRSEKYRFLPLFCTKEFEKQSDQRLVVVIPGGVSQKRRDYKRIFSKIKEIEKSSKEGSISEKSIEFVFLGKAKGSELKEMTDLERSLECVTIQYFPERVSAEDFEKWMQKADVLWCPIQPETEFFSHKEIYGTTKMTGNLGDAIKFGKWAVFPRNYPSKSDFIIPEEENIIEQFKMLKNTSYDFQKKYNRKSVQENLENTLMSLISI
jgi:glycosyltransferase involved in cell wall biosynthesis